MKKKTVNRFAETLTDKNVKKTQKQSLANK